MVSNLTGPGVHPPGTAADPATNTSLDESDSNAVTASGPGDIPLMLLDISDSTISWPANFQLDINLNNWVEWSRHVSLRAGCRGFTKWLEGTMPQPSIVTDPKGHYIWESNDLSLKYFLLTRISTKDYDSVHELPTANAVFEALRRTHVHAVPQAILIKQAADIRCLSEGELSKYADEVKKVHERIVAMGPIDLDQLLIAFLLNMLNDKLQPLQSQLIQDIIDDPSFSSDTIMRRLRQEDNFFRHRQQQNRTASTALVAQGRNKPRPSRNRSKRTGH